MDDLKHACTFFLIFAAVLLAYSLVLIKTGNKHWLPMRAQHSVRTKEDVRRVGRITSKVALVIATISAIVVLIRSLG